MVLVSKPIERVQTSRNIEQRAKQEGQDSLVCHSLFKCQQGSAADLMQIGNDLY